MHKKYFFFEADDPMQLKQWLNVYFTGLSEWMTQSIGYENYDTIY